MPAGRKLLLVLFALICVAVGVFWERVLNVPRALLAEEKAHQAELRGALKPNEIDGRFQNPLPQYDEIARDETPAPALQASAGSNAAAVYTVTPGDNPARIAKKLWGSSSLAHLLLAANPGVQATNLQIGQQLRVPERPQAPPREPAVEVARPGLAAGSQVYRLREGDQLALIAKKYYGSTADWPRIKDANPGLDERRLRPGTEIVIPPKAP